MTADASASSLALVIHAPLRSKLVDAIVASNNATLGCENIDAEQAGIALDNVLTALARAGLYLVAHDEGPRIFRMFRAGEDIGNIEAPSPDYASDYARHHFAADHIEEIPLVPVVIEHHYHDGDVGAHVSERGELIERAFTYYQPPLSPDEDRTAHALSHLVIRAAQPNEVMP
jgi:hypothetical protein